VPRGSGIVDKVNPVPRGRCGGFPPTFVHGVREQTTSRYRVHDVHGLISFL
jgi:hypothetical protein